MNSPLPTLHQLRKQAEANSPQAWFELGQHLTGLQQLEEANNWHRRAAEAGHAPSQVEFGRALLHGSGVPADPAQAVYWLQRADAADHPVAAYLLAFLSIGNVVVPRDDRINEGVKKAVNAGFPPALRAVAIHFGRKPAPEDQQRCLQLLQHGTERGDWVSALLLVERLQRGEGCTPNLKAAEALRNKLIQNGFAPLPSLSVPQVSRVPDSPNTLALDDAMESPPARALSEQPHIWAVDGLLSADECRLLIALSRPVLQPSRAIDMLSGRPVPIAMPSVSDVTFDPIAEDLSMRLVQQRMASAAGVEVVYAEPLRVQKDEPGGVLPPPVYDFLPPNSPLQGRAGAGNRARTICVFLNEPDGGGEFEFPKPDVSIKPQAGRAVIFDNLRKDGSPETDSQHASLPVRQGERWLATSWLRQGRYRAY
jgi:prolyl 4-hydroxylase